MDGKFRLLPISASNFSSRVDLVTLFLLCASALVILVISVLIIFFSIYYRESSQVKRDPISHKKLLICEIAWTAFPFLVFMLLFFWAGKIYFDEHAPPENSMKIHVTGKQWMWRFTHDDGLEELGELHIPAHQPIELIMSSEDVIHSFFIPAFRTKQDVVPGRYTISWFEATRPGTYRVFCTQYCGTHHAGMTATLVVLEPDEYLSWRQSGLKLARFSVEPGAIEKGRQIYETHACIACHEGNSKIRAPSLIGLYGSRVNLSDGGSVLADENYIHESIVNPGAKIVNGYENVMPSFQGLLSEQEIAELLAFIKSRKAAP